MGYDISENRILLHTIQAAEAFGVLLTNGVLKPDPALAEPPLHADGYDWMYRQMDAQLPTSGDGAIYLWARIRRQSLVELCRLAQGQVLLTCRVPRERVLLSHFGDWYAVLNRHPLIIEHPDESDKAHGARLDRIFEDVHSRVRAAGVTGCRIPALARGRANRTRGQLGVHTGSDELRTLRILAGNSTCTACRRCRAGRPD